MKYVVLPHCGLFRCVRTLPGIPWDPRLALAGDQAPVDGSDVILLGEGELPMFLAMYSVQIMGR